MAFTPTLRPRPTPRSVRRLPPPGADSGRLPVLYYLRRLTSPRHFMINAGARRAPPSPDHPFRAPIPARAASSVAGDREHWDFGIGAVFYVDATIRPWAKHYRCTLRSTSGRPIIEARFRGRGRAAASAGTRWAATVLCSSRFRTPAALPSRCAAFALSPHPRGPCRWGQKAFVRYPRRPTPRRVYNLRTLACFSCVSPLLHAHIPSSTRVPRQIPERHLCTPLLLASGGPPSLLRPLPPRAPALPATTTRTGSPDVQCRSHRVHRTSARLRTARAPPADRLITARATISPAGSSLGGRSAV